MENHLKESIETCGFDVNKTATSPAQKSLFEINDTSPILDQQDADSFHSTVAKLLYISLRARPDILLATSFLCT